MAILKSNRNIVIFEGVLFVILGILAILAPIASTIATELVVGWLLIFGGSIQAYRSIQARHAKGFYVSLASSILYVALGILLLLYPVAGIISLTFLVILFFLFEGIAKIVLAFQIRPMTNWGWLVVSGILSIVIATVIWMGWPGTAFWAIGLLVGINMLFLGATLIALGMTIPKIDLPPGK